MPLSSDPRRRRRQLANLKRGENPAAAGNRHHVTHGGYAAVVAERLETKQREVFDALAADAPLRDHDGELPRHDTVAVTMLAKALCRLEDVETHLTQRGLLDDDGNQRPAVDLERRLRAEIGDWVDALGMTPRSRAKLGLDVARATGFDLAQHWAQDDDGDVIDGGEAAA
jgi:hypothetical protein